MESPNLFDEKYYLDNNPDVAMAVARKMFPNGYAHFIEHGKAENRPHQFFGTAEKVEETNVGWSQHIIKGFVPPKDGVNVLNIQDVPAEFQPVQNVIYPEGNLIPFEAYFNRKFIELGQATNRTYLPIHWCAYYVNSSYGTDVAAIKKLQDFINTLDKSKKYFTITQHDDGIINDISGLDILVYAMGCYKPGYYPIPLISHPLNAQKQPQKEKNIIASFYGADTHPIRQKMVEAMCNSPYVALEQKPVSEYRDILSRSIFALCPRGYGATSFRMFEALAYGAIPVYISDVFIEPFNLPFNYGIQVPVSKIKQLRSFLLNADIDTLRKNGKEVYEKYFVYSQCAETIINTLNV